MFAGHEREQNMTRIVKEVQERMRTEMGHMETEFSERILENTSNHARHEQNMNMDDVEVKLNKHLERVENATILHWGVKHMDNFHESQEYEQQYMHTACKFPSY